MADPTIGTTNHTTAGSNTTSIAVTVPTGSAGDLLIGAVTTAVNRSSIPTPPAGWTPVWTGFNGDGGCWLGYRTATASEPSTYTFSPGSYDLASPGSPGTATITRITGSIGTVPLRTIADTALHNSAEGAGNSHSYSGPTVSNVIGPDLSILFTFWSCWFDPGGLTQPLTSAFSFQGAGTNFDTGGTQYSGLSACYTVGAPGTPSLTLSAPSGDVTYGRTVAFIVSSAGGIPAPALVTFVAPQLRRAFYAGQKLRAGDISGATAGSLLRAVDNPSGSALVAGTPLLASQA